MYTKEEAKRIRHDFWAHFGARCKVHPELKQRRRNFVLHKTKINGVLLRFEADKAGARVILELGQRNEDIRLKTFEILQRYKAIIEAGFHDGLMWEFYHQREDSNKEVCRIFTEIHNVDIFRQNQWPDIYNFFIDNMIRLEDNFMEVRDVLKAELEDWKL